VYGSKGTGNETANEHMTQSNKPIGTHCAVKGIGESGSLFLYEEICIAAF
jgi:hypothetical protein